MSTAAAADPADLTLLEAVRRLRERRLSARELVAACLRRIGTRDGAHSPDGDPESVNAWVRVYGPDALERAARCDERLSATGVRRAGPPPILCGVPLALKDIFAVQGRPLTASSRILNELPTTSCDVWQRLESAGAVLLGHVHTHEFAAGGTTDQVGNPWDLARTAGGSSGGSAAALAARMVPAATGTDTAGSLRIPSALCGTSTIKPTRGLVSLAGVVPLAASLDHAGPMARTVADCAALLAVMGDRADAATVSAARGEPDGPQPLTVALSPRHGGLDPDVVDGVDAALDAARSLGWRIVQPPDPPELDVDRSYWSLLGTEMLFFHRRFDARRDGYRPSTRQLVEAAEHRAASALDYLRWRQERRDATRAWRDWFDRAHADLLLEATVPVVAPARGDGYLRVGSDAALLSLTHLWNWTGFPVVSLPAGVGRRSGMPVGVSLVGVPGADGRLLQAGTALQAVLGTPQAPWRR